MATIAEVAEAAGVSISTVSYALSGKRSIKPATRDKVLAVAQELGYVPHASARMLAAQRTQIIAVSEPVHPDTDDTAHMTFAMETTKAARAANYDTLLLVHDDAVEGMARSAGTGLTDGIIVLDVDEDDPRVALSRTLACPTVFIGLPADTDGLICVDLDFEEAAARAVDMLVDAGHRAIGLISHREETLERGSNFPRRFRRAFERRAAERGVDHATVYPRGHTADGPVRRLLEQLPDLDGVVLNTTADVAATLSANLELHGRVVPRDVSVIAAGVSFSTARFRVPFDTMPLDARASCAAAMELLVEAIESHAPTPQIRLLRAEYRDAGSVIVRNGAPPPVAPETPGEAAPDDAPALQP
ncbi:LacI family DNA-binding transcriptional regulator [Demequina lignilytica]|uniref:LacI family DNA-binding transcriptional regulator n=1 Tax=Demequina lignilytica TaxID=3051663 RepID=A0AAW7M9V2_9MICO|nr:MULTISPECIES: LacI family DNA-binding transcriptional regulator [unclassified Demequina]MDN4478719.1 LacI family DNA-binding transcriptional regulator [Demequina sp. SYSU T00039-1]MDN4483269.1 LacI family DNA-binding transcriptional regulator [Demequina sp. SYSU T0a273]MDN4488696.1 LacI family DNA-binding transcriptional regulator [Demequina sp. SYSU T00039]